MIIIIVMIVLYLLLLLIVLLQSLFLLLLLLLLFLLLLLLSLSFAYVCVKRGNTPKLEYDISNCIVVCVCVNMSDIIFTMAAISEINKSICGR